MIFTTNKPLSAWGKVLHDEDLAAAILDRVLERGRFVPLDGPSGRTRHLSLEEVFAGQSRTAQNFRNQRLRISGTHNRQPTRYIFRCQLFDKCPQPIVRLVCSSLGCGFPCVSGEACPCHRVCDLKTSATWSLIEFNLLPGC